MLEAIIGIDGGGTKTNAVALDLNGHIIGRSNAGGMNYHFVPPEEAAQNVYRCVADLEITYRLHIRAVAVGNPTIDDTSGYTPEPTLLRALIAAGLREGIPLVQKSDVFMALYGLTRGTPGVVIVSGTGSMGAALDHTGKLTNIGGWGAPTADKGSGYAIALDAIQAVCDAADGVAVPTALTGAALSFFGGKTVREMSYLLNSRHYGRSELAAFARSVSACAADGDATAIGILARAADALANYAHVLLEIIRCDDVPIGIYGGVFQHNPVVVARFTQAVGCPASRHPVIAPQIPPEEAAARYLLDHTELWRDAL